MVHVHVQSVPELRECLSARHSEDSFFSRFAACCIPGTCTTSTVERYCNPRCENIPRRQGEIHAYMDRVVLQEL